MKKFILTAALLCFSLNVQAADRYVFDQSHTNIMWFASHFGFSKSMGQFMEFDGELMLDTENPANSSVNVTIKTDSLMTGLDKFDAHLKNEDFLDVAKFPEASFASTKVEVTGDNTALLHGDLTLMGTTKPISLDVTLNKLGTNPYNKKETVGFTVRGIIIREDFGITYALPGVSNGVDILIETELVKE